MKKAKLSEKTKLSEKVRIFFLHLSRRIGRIDIIRLAVNLDLFYLSILHFSVWSKKRIGFEEFSLIKIYLDIPNIFQRAYFCVYILGIGFQIDWDKYSKHRPYFVLRFWTKYFDFYSKAKNETQSKT
jgi:hypothetical protein